ncbi:efflux RND transporter periplasmic adaptor subunit [Colwellia sp. E2M01]|nr:efflux RND transporter periplasmic adaptor subunit [Colwellia sp. E2M01]
MIIAFLTTIISACGDNSSAKLPYSPLPQSISVDAAKVISQRITEWDNFTGRLESSKAVLLRPRVSGYIESVTFEEGELVNQGDTLFYIDNRQFNAEVARLQALLDEAKSRLVLAKQYVKRAQALYKRKAISKEILDTRESDAVQAKAKVSQSTAALDLAVLNQSFTRVEAPISGRISSANITEGNYVTAGSTIMTSIVSTKQLYAYFDIDEATWLNYQKKQPNNNKAATQTVVMRLANESEYQHWGKLNFVDNQVNTQTGTLRVRAVFDNQAGNLMPGLFAHLRLASNKTEQGVLIAEKAIGTDLSNKYVLVVDEENKVQYRAITMGDKIGALRIIKSGLDNNDTIILNGLQRVRPGSLVTPKLIDMADEDALNVLQTWQQKIDHSNYLAQLLPVKTLGEQ